MSSFVLEELFPTVFLLLNGSQQNSEYFSLLLNGSKRNSEHFNLPRNGSEQNSDRSAKQAEF